MKEMKQARPARPAALGALAAFLAGCAGATFGSGVGDAWLHEPPYYAGSRPGSAGTFAYVPIAFQAGASQAPIFEPQYGEGTELAYLLEAMNAHLASMAQERGIRPVAPLAGLPPDVQFGCGDGMSDECPPRGEGNGFGEGDLPMRLAVGRASDPWTREAALSLGSAGADALLVLTLEVGQYRPRYTNWRGSKAVELGTDHTVTLPWLTSMDTPVQVLQLTGALVDANGKAIRMGAEGIRARRTPLLMSGLGFQSLLSDRDVADALAARREDLPGEPPAWEVALRTLVDGLTGRR